VKSASSIRVLAAAAAMALAMGSSALAQRQPPSPEARLDRLERQVQQVQRQVFPKGRPADTAGFAGDPAATQSSVTILNQRLDALERQMSDLLRQSEENSHRLQDLEALTAKTRGDHEQRLQAIERQLSAGVVPAATMPSQSEPAARPPASKPAGSSATAETTTAKPAEAGEAPAGDPGEEAYSQAFHLWQDGQYDQAITALRAFTSAYPKHRRVSYANNLVGRALLDKGEPKAAAEALLANYRSNPAGERAPDSLYYLGQALTKLGQNGQACKAYSELDAVYGAKIRPDLKSLETAAKAQAQCG
jgi:TolA-binding protein